MKKRTRIILIRKKEKRKERKTAVVNQVKKNKENGTDEASESEGKLIRMFTCNDSRSSSKWAVKQLAEDNRVIRLSLR